MKVLVTGASGLLGRSLVRLLTVTPGEYDVVGLAYSRATPPLRKLDLLDDAAVSSLFAEVQPEIVIHCAAERFPDRAAADPERTKALNVGVCSRLADECAKIGACLVYISTDYVFDGGVKSGEFAPYQPTATPMPLNLYGETKRDGEVAVLGVAGAHPVVLRVPVLYGVDQATLDESASLVVANVLKGASTEPKKVDDWGIRFPTLVDDVSAALKLIIDRQRQPEKLSGIFHCTASERTTKYTLALMMAEILGVPSAHLVADSEPPAGAPRPQNTQLDPSSLWAAVGSEVKFTPLRDGLAKALEAHTASFASVD